LNYRFDIDGIRAIAIIIILIFHVDPRLTGGFIGVDIFFVISGFLITSMIWRENEKGDFSFVLFYAKRLRRLFPAFFVMVVSCFIFVLYFGLYYEITTYAKSALSSLFYMSNIFFYTQSDYFSADLELNPLLHTWSLSVEEQFYLIFPIIIFYLYKNKEKAVKYLVILFIISLCFSEFLVKFDSSAGFFLSPSRFWQFLAGAILAIYTPHIMLGRTLSETMAIFGGILIFGCVFMLTHESPFPGLIAIIPTLGTILLIWGTKNTQTTTNKLLSSPLPRFFGNISYSLYLWHWPVIVFYKINISPSLNYVDKIIVLIVAISLGYLSWKFVEQRTRVISLKKKKYFFVMVGLSSLLLSVLSLVAIQTNWLKSEKMQWEMQMESYISYQMKAQLGKCFLFSGADDVNFYNEKECITIGKENNVVLIGDSHAAQYYSALNTLDKIGDLSQITSSGCRPVLNGKGHTRCTELMKKTFKSLLDHYPFDTIILAARWQDTELVKLKETLEFLKNKVPNIIVIGRVIEYSQSLPILLARFSYEKDENEAFQITNARKYDEIYLLDKMTKEIVLTAGANYISAFDILCEKGSCLTELNGVPVQFDYSHLTEEGAEFIIKDIHQYMPVFASLK
jgi:peptidoglycan/LPS O-acetylase OafA/YrhL